MTDVDHVTRVRWRHLRDSETTRLIMAALDHGPSAALVSQLRHPPRCHACSGVFVRILELTTAVRLHELRRSVVEKSAAVWSPDALLSLWTCHLDASTAWPELRAPSTSLSVLGMLHRQLGRPRHAAELHERAVAAATEAGDTLSLATSHAELGYLAMLSEDFVSAERHLMLAGRFAGEIGDDVGTDVVERLQESLASYAYRLDAASAWRRLYTQILEPHAAAAAPVERVLVVETGESVPVEIDGPWATRNGRVVVTLRMSDLTLGTLPQSFTIELILTPTLDVRAVPVTTSLQRGDLVTLGLDVTASLPQRLEFDRALALAQQAHGPMGDRWAFPRSALALRIRRGD